MKDTFNAYQGIAVHGRGKVISTVAGAVYILLLAALFTVPSIIGNRFGTPSRVVAPGYRQVASRCLDVKRQDRRPSAGDHATTEYFVATDNPNASDANDGRSENQPFKTLGRAVQAVGEGDTLMIAAGVYREPLLPQRTGTPGNPIIFRANPGDEGRVLIRGSNVVTGWKNERGNIWSVNLQPLPLVDYPPGWPVETEISRRREMVFIDGSPLQQVLSAAEMTTGSFRVDDGAGKYFVYSAEDLNDKLTEIAERDRGIWAQGTSYITWIGLTVEHVANDAVTAAMHFGSYQQIEDCKANNNNQVGIMVLDGSVLVNNVANRNGRVGIAVNGSNSLLDSNETSYNAWRYGPDWDAGGVKIIFDRPANNLIVRHTANFNLGRGIWFDTTGSGNMIEDSHMEGNLIAGLQFEATQSPTWAINNVIISTGRANHDPYTESDGVGISMRDCQGTYIYNNTIIDVEGAGILISGDERNGGQDFMAGTQVFNNIVADYGSAAVRFWTWGLGRSEPRIRSHNFDNNLYYGNRPTIVFPDLDAQWGDVYWSLSQWQNNRGEDQNSHDAPLRCTNPTAMRFSLPSSRQHSGEPDRGYRRLGSAGSASGPLY